MPALERDASHAASTTYTPNGPYQTKETKPHQIFYIPAPQRDASHAVSTMDIHVDTHQSVSAGTRSQ